MTDLSTLWDFDTKPALLKVRTLDPKVVQSRPALALHFRRSVVRSRHTMKDQHLKKKSYK